MQYNRFIGNGKIFIEKTMETLGERIKAERINRKESQQVFAENVGISQSFLSDIERGVQIPGGEVLLAISRYTGISIDYIVKGKEVGGGNQSAVNSEIENRSLKIPLFLCPAAAGSPVPGDDYIEEMIDITTLLLPNKDRGEGTLLFSCRVTGDSMIGAGIDRGDYLVCSRDKQVRPGSIVVCSLNGELTVKRYEQSGGEVQLFPENPKYEPIRITSEDSFRIHGVLIRVVKSFS